MTLCCQTRPFRARDLCSECCSLCRVLAVLKTRRSSAHAVQEEGVAEQNGARIKSMPCSTGILTLMLKYVYLRIEEEQSLGKCAGSGLCMLRFERVWDVSCLVSVHTYTHASHTYIHRDRSYKFDGPHTPKINWCHSLCSGLLHLATDAGPP